MKKIVLVSVTIAVLLFSMCNSNKTDNATTDSTQLDTGITPTQGDTTLNGPSKPDSPSRGNGSLNRLKFCTEIMPADIRIQKKMDSMFKYMEMIPGNENNFAKVKIKEFRKPYITSLKDYKWPYKTLNVKFIDGNINTHNKVKEIIKEWETYSGIKFNYSATTPDITVSFNDKGYWSRIGRDSRSKVPSMSLTGIESEPTERDMRSVVLHEFGHALGFIHEHQSPKFDQTWDTAAVIKYYKDQFGWSDEDTKENVIFRYRFSQVNGTNFDPQSIMIYAIPAGLIRNRSSYQINWTYNLSASDKRFLKSTYP